MSLFALDTRSKKNRVNCGSLLGPQPVIGNAPA